MNKLLLLLTLSMLFASFTLAVETGSYYEVSLNYNDTYPGYNEPTIYYGDQTTSNVYIRQATCHNKVATINGQINRIIQETTRSWNLPFSFQLTNLGYEPGAGDDEALYIRRMNEEFKTQVANNTVEVKYPLNKTDVFFSQPNNVKIKGELVFPTAIPGYQFGSIGDIYLYVDDLLGSGINIDNLNIKKARFGIFASKENTNATPTSTASLGDFIELRKDYTSSEIEKTNEFFFCPDLDFKNSTNDIKCEAYLRGVKIYETTKNLNKNEHDKILCTIPGFTITQKFDELGINEEIVEFRVSTVHQKDHCGTAKTSVTFTRTGSEAEVFCIDQMTGKPYEIGQSRDYFLKNCEVCSNDNGVGKWTNKSIGTKCHPSPYSSTNSCQYYTCQENVYGETLCLGKVKDEVQSIFPFTSNDDQTNKSFYYIFQSENLDEQNFNSTGNTPNMNKASDYNPNNVCCDTGYINYGIKSNIYDIRERQNCVQENNPPEGQITMISRQTGFFQNPIQNVFFKIVEFFDSSLTVNYAKEALETSVYKKYSTDNPSSYDEVYIMLQAKDDKTGFGDIKHIIVDTNFTSIPSYATSSMKTQLEFKPNDPSGIPFRMFTADQDNYNFKILAFRGRPETNKTYSIRYKFQDLVGNESPVYETTFIFNPRTIDGGIKTLSIESQNNIQTTEESLSLLENAVYSLFKYFYEPMNLTSYENFDDIDRGSLLSTEKGIAHLVFTGIDSDGDFINLNYNITLKVKDSSGNLLREEIYNGPIEDLYPGLEYFQIVNGFNKQINPLGAPFSSMINFYVNKIDYAILPIEVPATNKQEFFEASLYLKNNESGIISQVYYDEFTIARIHVDPEKCDGKDNDRDGVIDNDIETVILYCDDSGKCFDTRDDPSSVTLIPGITYSGLGCGGYVYAKCNTEYDFKSRGNSTTGYIEPLLFNTQYNFESNEPWTSRDSIPPSYDQNQLDFVFCEEGEACLKNEIGANGTYYYYTYPGGTSLEQYHALFTYEEDSNLPALATLAYPNPETGTTVVGTCNKNLYHPLYPQGSTAPKRPMSELTALAGKEITNYDVSADGKVGYLFAEDGTVFTASCNNNCKEDIIQRSNSCTFAPNQDIQDNRPITFSVDIDGTSYPITSIPCSGTEVCCQGQCMSEEQANQQCEVGTCIGSSPNVVELRDDKYCCNDRAYDTLEDAENAGCDLPIIPFDPTNVSIGNVFKVPYIEEFIAQN